jgi:hypothetical protein
MMNAAISESTRSSVFDRGVAAVASSGGMTELPRVKLLPRRSPFCKDQSPIVRTMAKLARLFECLRSPRAGWHRPRLLKRINRFGVRITVVTRQIGWGGHDVGVIALGAVKGADIEAGRSARSPRQDHACIAFWATRSLAGDERIPGRGMSFRHQPSNVWASSQPLFLKSARRDKAVCRSWFRLAPLGRDRAKRRTSRRFSTRSAILKCGSNVGLRLG